MVSMYPDWIHLLLPCANCDLLQTFVKRKAYACRWWECVALPEDIDSSEEDSFRQQMRDLAFAVIMQQIIYFMGHYELFIFY